MAFTDRCPARRSGQRCALALGHYVIDGSNHKYQETAIQVARGHTQANRRRANREDVS